MAKYQNKYRIESHRRPGWDYSDAGDYFLTICTHKMRCILGKVIDGKMILNDFGKIAEKELLKSIDIRQELKLGEFVVMPNHIHAIVRIIKKGGREKETHSRASAGRNGGRDGDGKKETHGRASVLGHANEIRGANENGDGHANAIGRAMGCAYRRPKSISSFMAGYKSAVISAIDDFIDEHELDIRKYNKKNKFWHSNYHDRIIGDIRAYNRIKQYIRNNPRKWDQRRNKR